MNSFKSNGYLIRSVHWCNKTNEAVLPGVAGLHCDLACAYSPSLLGAVLGFVSDVIRNVWIVTGPGAFVLGWMPKAGSTDSLCLFIQSKFGRVEGLDTRVAVLPNTVGILVERKIGRDVKDGLRLCEQTRNEEDSSDPQHSYHRVADSDDNIVDN